MPAKRLDSEGTLVGPFHILGTDSELDPFMVLHVGFYSATDLGHIPLALGDTAPVIHMSPRFEVNGQLCCTVWGHSGLKDSEINALYSWLDRHEDEFRTTSRLSPWMHYIASPCSETIENKKNGVRRYRRFSCAGLIQEAFREAVGITLVELSDDALPQLDIDEIVKYYPAARDERIRRRIGLDRKPYSILLPGYLFHALDRSSAEIRHMPHRPKKEHSSFLGTVPTPPQS